MRSRASPNSSKYSDYRGIACDDAPILPGEGKADATFERPGIGDAPYLLAVGRLVPEKGLDDLIDAHATGDEDRKLLIVGGADHYSDYARELQGRAGDRVIFAGVQSRPVLRHCSNAPICS